jgi:hypothetical protein
LTLLRNLRRNSFENLLFGTLKIIFCELYNKFLP